MWSRRKNLKQICRNNLCVDIKHSQDILCLFIVSHSDGGFESCVTKIEISERVDEAENCFSSKAFKSKAKAFYRVLTYQRESSHASFNSRRKIRIPKFFFRAFLLHFSLDKSKTFLMYCQQHCSSFKAFLSDFSIHMKQ